MTLQDMTPLEALERLRAEFLGMVSHELRMPLTSIRGSATALLDASPALDPAEMRQYHRIIADQADHMRELIGDLLDVARIETGALPVDPEPVEVAALVDRARTPSRVEGAGTTLTSTLGRTCHWLWRTGGAWPRSSSTCCPTRPGTLGSHPSCG